jgi:hypothetical protein
MKDDLNAAMLRIQERANGTYQPEQYMEHVDFDEEDVPRIWVEHRPEMRNGKVVGSDE